MSSTDRPVPAHGDPGRDAPPGLDLPDAMSRRTLLGAVGAGAALLAAGCSNPGRPPTTTTPGGGACRLTPEQTEGPYYIDDSLVRRNITDGRPGTPLTLTLTVQDPSCQPRPGAAVDIWHCDAVGAYSGFGAGAGSRTFLRGTQVAGADGVVTFETIYPGWYVGRATHIHVKVHTGGREIHTGQLYFDEAVNNAVYRTAPYTSHVGTRTMNAWDVIYLGGGAQSMVQLAQAGTGYTGTKTLVVS
jgi:protocatechuate 3,4-dioxygenase beta subunit